MSTLFTKKLFTVDEYHRMVDAGILREGDRVELINGEVLTMSPIGLGHMAALDRATRLFVTRLGESAIVRVGGSVRLDSFNEPQPDLVVLRAKEDFYLSGAAAIADIYLIVEVSDSSLRFDLAVKAGLYAERGIVEYWVVDVESDVLIAHSEPSSNSFRTVHHYHRGDVITPSLLPTCRMEVSSLLP
jgi:Uma2 family endonuclease